MQIVMLYFEPSLERFFRKVFEMEGYLFTSTMDPDEALRALEASTTPCILLTDNIHVNPIIRDALTRLRATPGLQGKVWVMDYDPRTNLTQEFLDQGLLDELVVTPVKTEDLFALLERIRDCLP